MLYLRNDLIIKTPCHSNDMIQGFVLRLNIFYCKCFHGKKNYRTYSLHFHIHVFTKTDKRHAKLKSNNLQISKRKKYVTLQQKIQHYLSFMHLNYTWLKTVLCSDDVLHQSVFAQVQIPRTGNNQEFSPFLFYAVDIHMIYIDRNQLYHRFCIDHRFKYDFNK